MLYPLYRKKLNFLDICFFLIFTILCDLLDKTTKHQLHDWYLLLAFTFSESDNGQFFLIYDLYMA